MTCVGAEQRGWVAGGRPYACVSQKKGTYVVAARPEFKLLAHDVFEDDALNPLVDLALTGNQSLRVAAARLDQARAQLTAAAADFGPNELLVDELSPREHDVLGHLAEGKSNQGIAESLVVTTAAVEKHITSIFQKLELDASPTEHRRVLAALTYLRDPAH